MKKRFSTLVAILSILAAVFISQPGGASATTEWASMAWSGYVNFYPANHNISYDGTILTMTVPWVDSTQCASGPDLIALWTGLGGDGGGYQFTQAGISITNANTVTGAWFEWFSSNPNYAPVTNVSFNASPGDVVTVKQIWGTNHETVYVLWWNRTTGQKVRRNFDLGSANFPANGDGDWIAERQSAYYSPNYPYIPWFGNVSFTGAQLVNVATDGSKDADGMPEVVSYLQARDASGSDLGEFNMDPYYDHWTYTLDPQIWNVDQYLGQFHIHQNWCS